MASLSCTTRPNQHCSQLKPTKSHKLNPTHLIKLKENDNNHHTLSSCYIKQISSLCKDGHMQEAVDFLTDMEYKNFSIGPQFYAELLQGCVYERDLFVGQQIHANMIKNGKFFIQNEYIETKLVILYAKCDSFDAAVHLFNRLREQNVFSCAAIIGMYCRMGLFQEALVYFCEMQENGILADNFVLPNVLKACGALQYVGYGKGVHGYVLKLGFEDCVFAASSLVDMYGKCGLLGDATKVFDKMSDRNVVAWNSMISSYVQNGKNEEAMEVFCDMRMVAIEPSHVTLVIFFSASANLCAVEEGKQCHAVAILRGLDLDDILGSSIMNFYAKVGLVQDAELVFHRMLKKDVVTWNLLISCYMKCGEIGNALNFCRLMIFEGFRFDSVTLSSILSASADTRDLKLGKEGHCYCIRNYLETDVVVASCIVDMYAKCGIIFNARRVFDLTKLRDLVLWNTLLAAYAELGLSGETLKLFYKMQLESVPPNVISWNSVILGFLRNGQVNEAMNMFSEMESLSVQPNIITYATLVNGLAQNGFGSEANKFFEKMLDVRIGPNFVKLL